MIKTKFDQLNLSKEILSAIKSKGLEYTTPVQTETIPPMLEGKDVIAKAPTGTGKTFAFGIPVIEQIDPKDQQIQALILAPTRELAIQISSELRLLTKFKQGIGIVCLYGGQPIGAQIQMLKKRPKIVVATPGRLQDHLDRKTVKLGGVKTVVLDEADRMVDMGFYKDVTKILDLTINRRNLALLSATMSREVMDIGWIYQRDPVEITIEETKTNKPNINQYSLRTDEKNKTAAIMKIIAKGNYERALVFCNTKRKVERLTEWLGAKGYAVDCIHGDIRQSIREKVLTTFRKGGLNILVATDVAARGIDVDDIDTVFNYDVPLEMEDYTHRIGRTGRAKKSGVAYTFVSNIADAVRLSEIEKFTHSNIRPLDMDINKKMRASNPNHGKRRSSV